MGTFINVGGADWAVAVREFIADRNKLVDELAGFPIDHDRSNFLRGRIEELNRLITLKKDDSKQ